MKVEEIDAQTVRYRRDRALIREAMELIRREVGTLRARSAIEGVNDGSDDSHFFMTMFDEPREVVEKDHRMGAHATLPRPLANCWICQQRLTQFRRRREMKKDIVGELGGHCTLCREPVTNIGARFVHRRGGKSDITQRLQGDIQAVIALAREDYLLLCTTCSSKGGRKKVVEREMGTIPVMRVAKDPRKDKGKPRRRPGESLAHFRLRCGGKM